MSSPVTPPPDIATIVFTRAAKSQTTTVTLPPAALQMLDWIVANLKKADGTAYTDAGNVIFADVMALLVPEWGAKYFQGQMQAAQTQVNQQVAAAIAAVTVA